MTKIIGLTGRSGAGKGAVCAIFQKYGIPSIDADAVYHDLLSQKNACTDELVAAFGAEILGETGLVERKKLSAIIFGAENPSSRLHTLNAITHKYIMAQIWDLVHAHTANGARAVIIDAPQLFEAGVENACDFTIGVIADTEQCLSRIMARDGIPRDIAERRLAAQHDNDFFRQSCTAVIENNTDLAALESQVRQIITDFEVSCHFA